MKIKLKNNQGFVRSVPVGFSWTTFFFGFFVPLCRGDIKNCAIMILTCILTLGLAWFFYIFKYNKIYLCDLLMKGFEPVNDEAKAYLIKKGMLTETDSARKGEIHA